MITGEKNCCAHGRYFFLAGSVFRGRMNTRRLPLISRQWISKPAQWMHQWQWMTVWKR